MSNHIIIRPEVTKNSRTRCAVLSHPAFAKEKVANPRNARREIKAHDLTWIDIKHKREFNERVALIDWARKNGWNPDQPIENLQSHKAKADVKVVALAGPDGDMLRELEQIWKNNNTINARIFELEDAIMSRQQQVVAK